MSPTTSSPCSGRRPAPGHGVAVTVGAGVNCVGMSPSGRRAWFPALGEITGDWGGGPDIGTGGARRGRAQRGRPRRTDGARTRSRCVLRLRNRARGRGRDPPGRPQRRAARRAAAARGHRRRGRRRGSARDHAPPGIRGHPARGCGAASTRDGGFAGAGGARWIGAHLEPLDPSRLHRRRASGPRRRKAQTSLCTTRPVVGAALAGLALAGANGAPVAAVACLARRGSVEDPHERRAHGCRDGRAACRARAPGATPRARSRRRSARCFPSISAAPSCSPADRRTPPRSTGDTSSRWRAAGRSRSLRRASTPSIESPPTIAATWRSASASRGARRRSSACSSGCAPPGARTVAIVNAIDEPARAMSPT